jgi:hypothetical protein
MSRIQPGKTHRVTVEHHSFKVRAIRSSAVNGWWLCEGETTGERVMLPEGILEEDDKDADQPER